MKQHLIDNQMIIRQEKEQDYAEIYNLIKTAFETAKVKDGDEQDFAVKLRAGETYIPELALVREKGGKLIGHIMFTKLNIHTPDGIFEVLLLAPISVLPEYQNQRVGTLLIKKDLNWPRRWATPQYFYVAILPIIIDLVSEQPQTLEY